ncbi:MAG: hypothetical protein A2X05_04010 [Bacteroidetes bacterium GWE2_41_25]|nr:MAG: hypothetical protein A2X03_06125 [Bacteroidetes bacterium GWA2_40_15]OFX85878.1 MAG: hypothetical protein A2X06_16065 [Bacteroidetes bacterium GWC2_40_22]OFY06109.1 MAG: hypothetical protein A2X05_04010 [Bacteroidetes bacterium GWE2_41_25]OFY60515.1 MAG: hypothetical protein A2X04_00880 [Bacteroidetes bacterium GWF2_41_9]HAM10177.1 hypothetical protein [Bacteroidales bacterium]
MQGRRDFLKDLAMLTGSLMLPVSGFANSGKDKWGKLLPLRKLGRTGVDVTMLGLGGRDLNYSAGFLKRQGIRSSITRRHKLY